MLNLIKSLSAGDRRDVFITIILLVHLVKPIKTRSLFNSDFSNLTHPSTEGTKLHVNKSTTTNRGCYSTFSGQWSSRLGHSELSVYELAGKHARTILPKLIFSNPKWTRLDTTLSVPVRNCTRCASLFKNSLPYKFPYCVMVDDNHRVSVEYNVTDLKLVERRKFDFHLPYISRRNVTNLEEWEVFVYVDTTNPRKAVIYWETSPPELNITRYQLIVACHGTPPHILELEDAYSYEIPYHLTSPKMLCWCYVKPWLPSLRKWGYQSSCPPVIIMRGEVLPLWTLVMFLSFAVLVFLSLRLCRTIKLRCKHKITDSAMLVYEAKTEEQFKFVCLLAQTLQGDYNIKVYFDHQDIPNTDTKDPLRWFVEAIPKCQYFIFIQLPVPGNAKYVPPGIYSSQKMVTKNMFRMFKDSPRIINVTLASCPYEETWLCSNLQKSYKYILPDDLCMLVGKKNPFKSALGMELKQAITDCIEQIKNPSLFEKRSTKSEENWIEGSLTHLSLNEEKESESEESTETAAPVHRCFLGSLNLDGKKFSDSDTD